jgi:hypothetical protein
MSTVRAAGNVAPIPFLSVVAESVENIVESAQVCSIIIDSRSQLIPYNQTIERNQEALENLANDSKDLVVLLWGTYHQSHDQKNWLPEELREELKSLVRYVSGFPLDIASKHQHRSAFFKTYVALSIITCCETLPLVFRSPRNYKNTRRHLMFHTVLWKDSRSAYSFNLLLHLQTLIIITFSLDV